MFVHVVSSYNFSVTEHVWEEVEVDDVAPAAPTAVLANHASPKPKMMTTPAPKAAPASAPSSDTPAAKKTPAGGTKRCVALFSLLNALWCMCVACLFAGYTLAGRRRSLWEAQSSPP